MTPRKKPQAPKPASRPKILIVDDDPAIREILATQMGRLDYATATASDGEEAVRVFRAESPDLVIMDLMMPKIDGLAACKRIRALEEKKGRRTPVLFLTARDTSHDRLSSALSGGDDFVSKPISLQELCVRVEAALGRKKWD
ncbi:MAG: response regulator [Elusimicrobia bacterium]|nr:response regulator [Elusimicrobiota bacterium]